MFCSVATATNFEFIAYGTDGLGEISRPNLSRLRFAPAATEAPDRPDTGSARRDR